MSTTWKIEEGRETEYVTLYFKTANRNSKKEYELNRDTVEMIRELPDLTILSLMQVDAVKLNNNIKAHFAAICKDVYKTIVEKKWEYAATGDEFVFNEYVVDEIFGPEYGKSAHYVIKQLEKGTLKIEYLDKLQKYFDDPQKVKEVVA